MPSDTGPVDRDLRNTMADTGSAHLPRDSASGRLRAIVSEAQGFGPYTLLTELGRGANGVVYKVTKPGLGRLFALKILLSSADDEDVRRFLREARLASRITDPGVLGVVDVGFASGHHYYVMDYCEGETLRDRLRHGPLPAREAAEIVRELARIVDLAHGQGVTHRDLKPANIILEAGSGRPRVTDFGLARDHRDLASSLSKTGDVFGTPVYMAPEQIRGDRVDGRADLYALGVIFYEMLTGQLPFYDDDLSQLSQRVQDGECTPPSLLDPKLPPAVDRICAQAMATAREDRYVSGAALGEDLQAYLEGRAPDAVRRRPWLVAAVLGLLLPALALAVFASRQSRQGDGEPVAAKTTDVLPPPSPDPPAVPPALAALLTRASELASHGTATQLRPVLERARARSTGAPELERRVQTVCQSVARQVRTRAQRLVRGGKIAAATPLLELAAWLLGGRESRAISLELRGHARTLRRWRKPFEQVDACLIAAGRCPEITADQRCALKIDRAQLAYARARFPVAIQVCQDLLNRPGRHRQEAKLVLGFAISKAFHDYERGRKVLREVYASRPENAATWTAGSYLYVLRVSGRIGPLEEQGQAESLARKALQARPGYALALVSLGFALQHGGRDQEAVQTLERGVQQVPDHWHLYSAYATELWKTRRTVHAARARRAFGRLLELTRPRIQSVIGWLRYALLFVWEKQPKQLLALVKTDQKQIPDRGVPLAVRAIAHYMLGDLDAARADWKQAVRWNYQVAEAVVQSTPKDIQDGFVAAMR